MDKTKLVEENLKLVYFVINKNYPTFKKDEDVIQAGMVGLCKAAKSFDESKSKFSTYASRCILVEIAKEFCSRQDHSNLLSLDFPVNVETGEINFGDFLIGSKNIEHPTNLLEFYDTLNNKEQKYFDLLSCGFSHSDIARLCKRSRQSVNQMVHRMKLKWEKFNGD